ncbi:cation:proton antiporter [Limosilactobacillus caecicola]|uniref:cation:proton antiporter n=1 Tax=Limosilactobacillus caecicola TaxID=2941332 RepID=UPI00203B56A5|nr:cation:proton antiporter [Limosilactobacillus caecicola]
MNYLLQIVLILLVGKVCSEFSSRIGLPPVMGELIAGILIGPAVLHLLTPTVFIHYFSQIGVIMLMFIAGLEGNLKQLLHYWAPSLTVATLGVIFPTGTAFLLCHYAFNFDIQTAAFMGLVLSATSVSITVQVLREMGYSNTRESQIILGAAVADDIICIILLGVSVQLVGKHSASSLSDEIISMVLPQILFFVIVLLIGRFIVPTFLKIFDKMGINESLPTAALIICFGFSWIAVKCGMSDVLGAYCAGLAISQTNYEQDLEPKIEPIGYAIFTPVFFISIGLEVTFKGIGNDILFILCLIAIAVLGKQLGCGIGAKLFHLNWKEANVVGAGMVSRGEMALVVIKVALSSGLIDKSYFTSLILVTVITTLLAPLLLKIFIQRNVKSQNKERRLD